MQRRVFVQVFSTKGSFNFEHLSIRVDKPLVYVDKWDIKTEEYKLQNGEKKMRLLLLILLLEA